jgi:hypothetical protein
MASIAMSTVTGAVTGEVHALDLTSGKSIGEWPGASDERKRMVRKFEGRYDISYTSHTHIYILYIHIVT